MEERRETITVEEKEELEGAPPSDSIKVSNNRSLFFYVDLATKFLLSHETVDISGLGGAIPTVVTIAEILKNQDVAKITSITTSLTTLQEHTSPKPKMEIKIQKSDQFEAVYKQKKQLAQENKEIHLLVEQAQKGMQERLKVESNRSVPH
eukprot:TRINITY_DN1053_c0_g1_i1.p1 TRINITY_DN1053_c0_g1~~TRINITY_DN1053_c0_g1_i1.p1  ORF type:complete len:150 (-),score=38.31 TRINITY_DN1053_c0_g1_i1:140-589(-)